MKTKFRNQLLWKCNDSIRSTNELQLSTMVVDDEYGTSNTMIQLAIKNWKNRSFESVNLSYNNLFKYMQLVKKHINGNIPSFDDHIMIRIKNNKKNFNTTFLNTNEYKKTVLFTISTKGEDFFDSQKFYMPLIEYLSLLKLLQSLRDDYVSISMNTNMIATIKGLNDDIYEMKNTLDALYKYHLSNENKVSNNNIETYISNKETDVDKPVLINKEKTNTIIDEEQIDIDLSDQDKLNKFIDNNLEDMKISIIPELIESKKKTFETHKSAHIDLCDDFTKKKLKKDFMNLEKMIMSLSATDNPIRIFTETLKEIIIDPLPSYSEDDIINTEFSLTMSLKTSIQDNLMRQKPLSLNIFPFHTVDNDDTKIQENVDLMYTLYSYVIYYTLVVNQLKEKSDIAVNNKTFQLYVFKMITLPFIYRYLKYITRDEFIFSIETKLKLYRKLGVFKNFEQNILDTYGLDVKISDPGVLQSANKTYDVINDKWDVLTIDNFFTKLKVNSIIDDTYESFKSYKLTTQTMQKYILLIFNFKKNDKINFDELKEDCKDFSDIPEEIYNRFELEEKQFDNTNLIRVCQDYCKRNNIKWDDYNDFISNINIWEKNITDDINLNEIPEFILKSIYLWNPNDDDKIMKNYKYFKNKVLDSVLTKEMLIPMLNSDTNNKEVEDFAGSLGF